MSRIMIVDDSEITLEVTKHALESAGHDVVTLKSPLGLTAALYRQRPDLLLLDVDMPALSGEKVAELVKSNQRFDATRVVLYSSRSNTELKDAAARCGADGYVQKTGQTETLLATVDQLLSR